ncbi:MAG: MBG domain-containing protein [Oscillospiraceae bacterium]|nr:MBG domain-containing protein [Oscillospiraceae bacterium]
MKKNNTWKRAAAGILAVCLVSSGVPMGDIAAVGVPAILQMQEFFASAAKVYNTVEAANKKPFLRKGDSIKPFDQDDDIQFTVKTDNGWSGYTCLSAGETWTADKNYRIIDVYVMDNFSTDLGMEGIPLGTTYQFDVEEVESLAFTFDTVSAAPLTYSGEDQKPVLVYGKNEQSEGTVLIEGEDYETVEGTIVHEGNDVFPPDEHVSTTHATGAGTYDMLIKPLGDFTTDNPEGLWVSWKISEAEPTVTAPGAGADAVYDGEKHRLFVPGSVTGGILQYGVEITPKVYLADAEEITVDVSTLKDGDVLQVTRDENSKFKFTGGTVYYRNKDGSLGYMNGTHEPVPCEYLRYAYLSSIPPYHHIFLDSDGYGGMAFGDPYNAMLVSGKDGDTITLEPIVYKEGDTVTAWSIDIPTAKDVGEYPVSYRVASDLNYNGQAAQSLGTVMIAPATVTVSGLDDLTYDPKKSQTLVDASALPDDVTVEYSLEDPSKLTGDAYEAVWKPEIPKGTNAATYDIWYRIQPDSENAGNYTLGTDSAGEELAYAATTATIAPAIVTVTAVKGLTYKPDTSHQLVDISEVPDGVKVEFTLEDPYELTGDAYEAIWKTGIPEAKNADFYTVYYRVTDPNYAVDADGSAYSHVYAYIERKTLELTGYEGVYDSSPHDLVDTSTLPEDVTMLYALVDGPDADFPDDPDAWSTKAPQKTDAGTYHVLYMVETEDENSNYAACSNDNFGLATATIAQATPKATVSTPEKLTYTGKPLPLLEVTPEDKTCKAYYSTDGEQYDTAAPTGIDTGEYTVWYKIKGDGKNFKDSDPVSVTVEIFPATLEFTAPTAKTLTYSGSAQALVTAGSVNEGCTMQYSLDGKSYSDKIPTGTKAGTYTVYYKVENSDNYTSVEGGSVDVTIKKAAIKPTVSLDGWIYGDAANTPSFTGNTGKATPVYTYYQGETKLDKPPVNAGDYTVKMTIPETDNYSAGEATADFTIAKAAIEPTVAIEGWTYGEDANEPTVSGNTGSGKVTYTYYQGKTKLDKAPTAAGSYTVKATVAETPNYLGGEAEAAFTIGKASIEPTVSINGWTYGDTAAEPTVTGNDGSGKVTYTYYQGKTKLDGVPTNAGAYTLVASVPATANYFGGSAETQFTIAKKPLTITANNAEKIYGTEDPELTYAEITLVGKDTLNGALEREEGNAVGEYAITQGSLSAGDNYDITFVPGTLTIKEAQFDVTAEGFSGIYDGKAHGITVSTDVEGAQIYFLESTYKPTEADFVNDGSSKSPAYTNTGSHKVWYCITTDNYDTVISYQTVAITKAQAELTVQMKDWTYGKTASTPSISSDNTLFQTELGNKANAVTYTYFAGETQLDSVPTDADTYTVRATVSGLDNFADAFAETTFTIEKAPIDPQVAVNDWTYGDAANVPVVSGNAGNGAVTFTYYQDGKELDGVPTNAGGFTVTATITETDNYLGGKAEADFSIEKAVPTQEAEASMPTDLAASEGEQLVDILLPERWDWVTPTLTLSKPGKHVYPAMFTPMDTSNYETLTTDLTVEVAEVSVTAPTALDLTYTGKAQELIKPGSASSGTMLYSLNGKNWSEDIPSGTDAGDYTVYYKVNGKESSVNVTIAKADPEVESPTGLTATFGDFLADVALPEGWKWNDDANTTVGAVGSDTFTATYTPEDTNNYNTITAELIVTVNPADAEYTVPADITATYGDTLASITLPKGWSWNDPTASVGNAGNHQFEATYSSDENHSNVTVKLNVAVAKAVPIVHSISAGALTYGQTLADSALTGKANVDGAFAWKDATVKPTAAESGTTFVALFTPEDTDNYETAEADVIVTVAKADPAYTLPAGLTATVGQDLSAVKLPAGWTWAAPETELTEVGEGSYKAVFTPVNTANYNTIEAELTVTVVAEGKVIVDKSDLMQVIADAEAFRAANIAYVKLFGDLDAALETAKQVAADDQATQEEVDEAIEALSIALADAKATVEEIVSAMNSIVAIGEVKLDKECLDRIFAAREEYEALSDKQKTFVINALALQYAEQLYQALSDKLDADAARKAAEEAKAAAEDALKESEAAREAAEKQAKDAEKKAADADAAKQNAEEAQAAAEASRKDAEDKAAAAEKAKQEAEEAKKAGAEDADAKVAAAKAAEDAAKEAAEKAQSDKEAADQAAKEAADALEEAEKAAKLAEEQRIAAEQAKAEAEQKAAAEKEAADKAAAAKVIEKIKQIGKVTNTNESENKIISARAAYDILTDEQKKLVTNYITLTDAEALYKMLPQTGMSRFYNVIAGLAGLMGITGIALVKKSKKKEEEEEAN